MLDLAETLILPGVSSGLTGLLAKQAGARALLLPAEALAASMGMPDVGLITLDELARAARQIVRVTRLPLLVGAGTGFGGPLMVMRTVRELEGARCAAIQLTHDPSTQVPAFVAKVAAATSARQHLVIVVRIDAEVSGAEQAARLALACREVGADVLFPDGLGSEDALAAFARDVPGPLLTSLAERTPSLSAARLGELGYRLVSFPMSATLVAAKRVGAFYGSLVRDGLPASTDERLTRGELGELLGRDDYLELDRASAGDPDPLP
jgi:methylisocitrate lyase